MKDIKKPSVVIAPKYSTTIKTTVVLLCCSLSIAVVTYIIYNFTQTLLTERLRERISAIVATAATQFDPIEVASIQSSTNPDDVALVNVVNQLTEIRDSNSDIRFAYILRRTNDPAILEFVADAETLDSREEQETRNDGPLKDDELAPQPGDPFEIQDYPALRDEAFFQPTAEKELQQDQWSTQISAYAPIKDSNEDTIAIIGVDVEVRDFLERTQTTLLPFLLFIVFLILLLALLTSILIRAWGERVKILEEVDKEKDELLGIVSHQLAQPITALKWNLETLLDGDTGKLNTEQNNTMVGMQQITSDLNDLVSMILDVSRIQLGKMKFESEPFELNEMLSSLLTVIEPKAMEKHILLIKNVPTDLPTVRLNKRYTRMIVENLLSNAVKYTPENGKVELTVKVNANQLFCEVQDTGYGIPAKDQKRIFERLYRASNVKNSIEGNGFGLFIVKGAVEGQGGTISFESKQNIGTKFTFTLPLKK